MKSYVLKVELEEEDDGAWTAVVPLLPGCAASGDSVDEALENVRDLAQAYIEVLLEDGLPVPDGVITVMEGPAVAVVA